MKLYCINNESNNNGGDTYHSQKSVIDRLICEVPGEVHFYRTDIDFMAVIYYIRNQIYLTLISRFRMSAAPLPSRASSTRKGTKIKSCVELQWRSPDRVIGECTCYQCRRIMLIALVSESPGEASRSWRNLVNRGAMLADDHHFRDYANARRMPSFHSADFHH